MAVYCRTSTDEQKDANTIERQLTQADVELQRLGLVQANGGQYKLYPRFQHHKGDKTKLYFVDDGYNLEREDITTAFHEMTELIKQGVIHAIYIDSIDRLFRSSSNEFRGKILDLVENYCIDIHLPSGQLTVGVILQIMAVLGAEDKTRTTRRLFLSRKQRFLDDKVPVNGLTPYGYLYNETTKDWEIVEDEAKWIRHAAYLTSGKYSNDMPESFKSLLQQHPFGVPDPALAKIFNAHGATLSNYNKRNGFKKRAEKNSDGKIKREWFTNVFDVRSKKYCGTHTAYFKDDRYLNKKVGFKIEYKAYTINVPAILSENEWNMAVAAREKRRLSPGRHPEQNYLLSRKLICAECGCVLSAVAKHPKQSFYRNTKEKKQPTLYYKCPNASNRNRNVRNCKSNSCHNAKTIEPLVWSKVCEFINNPVAVKSLEDSKINKESLSARLTLLKNELSDVKKKIDNFEKQAQRFIKLNATDKITDEQFDIAMTDLNKESNIVKREKNRIEREIESTTNLIYSKNTTDIQSVINSYSQKLNLIEFREKKEIIHSVVDRAMISASGQITIEFNEFDDLNH